MTPKDAVGVELERSGARPKSLKEQGLAQFIETLRTDLDDMLRARLREELDDVLRLLIDRALLVDSTHEANILLDALVLLNRDTDDVTTPITEEERLAVMPTESD